MTKLKPQRGSAWSLTKEYRREASRRRRINVGNDKVNLENRKSYHNKIAKLLAIQRGEIADPTNLLEKFIKTRMVRSAKWRAKQQNLEFELTTNDIVLPTHCPVSGIELRLAVLGPESRAAYSLDRIDNTKGYTKDNVRVISKEVNAIKGANDVAFFERLIAYMKGEI